MNAVRKQFVHYPTAQAKHTAAVAATAEMHSYSSSAGYDMQRGALIMVLSKLPAVVRLLLLYDYIFKFKQQLLPPSNLYKSVDYWYGRTLAMR